MSICKIQYRSVGRQSDQSETDIKGVFFLFLVFLSTATKHCCICQEEPDCFPSGVDLHCKSLIVFSTYNTLPFPTLHRRLSILCGLEYTQVGGDSSKAKYFLTVSSLHCGFNHCELIRTIVPGAILSYPFRQTSAPLHRRVLLLLVICFLNMKPHSIPCIQSLLGLTGTARGLLG